MKLNYFVDNFRLQLENADENAAIDKNTIFKELSDWGSLTALMVLDMIDDEFSVSLTGDELKSCKTIGDLYTLVMVSQRSIS